MKALEESTIIICSIVKNAERGLKVNIPVINELCGRFKDFRIVVYENDSKDQTKYLLRQWTLRDKERIHVLLNASGASNTIPSKGDVSCNPFFSKRRIEKMARLRNFYMEYVDEKGWTADYFMVVDLDVARLFAEPVIATLKADKDWDVVTAFGYSRSPRLSKRYHDGYALTMVGDENCSQTEEKIYSMPGILGKLKPDDDWLKVYSAFGGLATYKFEAVKGLRYSAIPNKDPRVEVHCEHFSLCKQIHERGYDNIFIVPDMVLKYQSVTLRLLWNTLKRKLL